MNVYPLPSRFSNEGLILPDVVRVDTVVVGNVVVVPVGLVERGVIVMSTSRGGKSVVSGSNPFVVFGGDVVVVLSVEVVNVVAAVIVVAVVVADAVVLDWVCVWTSWVPFWRSEDWSARKIEV